MAGLNGGPFEGCGPVHSRVRQAKIRTSRNIFKRRLRPMRCSFTKFLATHHFAPGFEEGWSTLDWRDEEPTQDYRRACEVF